MELTRLEQAMLAGDQGRAVRKSMEILVALGEIYGAQRLTPVSSVQIAGVSYDNLGEAGLQFLEEMASGGGEARVLATLNPAGMDVENWEALGIEPDFARQQQRVIDAFTRMKVVATCTCTPYLAGNIPAAGEHIAWAESSAVCYANSVLGARTNREGGPSALAAALTGRTAEYGYHLAENRLPDLCVEVQAQVAGTHQFGALGKVIGESMQAGGISLSSPPEGGLRNRRSDFNRLTDDNRQTDQTSIRPRRVPYILGVEKASLEELKSFCASLATYGGAALFHMPGLTPEAGSLEPPQERITILQDDLEQAIASLSDASPGEVDFVSLGCPHLTIAEIARIAELLRGRKVQREFWITTARPTRQIADRLGYSEVIEASGAKFAADTCCVVAPIRGLFKVLATDSAKACYYAYSKNRFKTVFKSFDEAVAEALRPLSDLLES
jgi:hypothetical protein